ncbi:hypothetical protein J2S90_004307, partial [Arthrobacter bambusae]|nr:hypothetical protein [Arthrobacter bambusae]MDQ0131183.1 hypothetical protein [Arthrobacter bambusae]MDQ0182786.1 hypothetical protein [Arthrobacter bambusae]
VGIPAAPPTWKETEESGGTAAVVRVSSIRAGATGIMVPGALTPPEPPTAANG